MQRLMLGVALLVLSGCTTHTKPIYGEQFAQAKLPIPDENQALVVVYKKGAGYNPNLFADNSKVLLDEKEIGALYENGFIHVLVSAQPHVLKVSYPNVTGVVIGTHYEERAINLNVNGGKTYFARLRLGATPTRDVHVITQIPGGGMAVTQTHFQQVDSQEFALIEPTTALNDLGNALFIKGSY